MSKRWLALLLFGVWIGGGGVAHAMLSESPGTLAFGNVVLLQAPTKNATLSANGGTDVMVTVALEASGDCSQFLIVSPTMAVPVNSSTSQTIVVQFKPTSAGAKTCTIDYDDGTTVRTFTATGTGLTPTTIAVSPNPPTPLAFGNVDLPTTSAAQSLTATNTGDAALTIASGTFTTGASDYTIVTAPSSTVLAPNQTATWTIACHPSTRDARPGTFEITSDATNTPTVDVPLTCNGVQASLVTNPTSVPFGPVQRGTTQPATFTLSNPGNVDVTGISAAINPTGKGYTIDPVTPVPPTIMAGKSVTLNVKFAPTINTDGGPAAITFTGGWGNAETAVATLALSGASASVSASQATLDFMSFRFDSHPTRPYQITNDGGSTIMVTSADFTPDNNGTSTGEYTSTFALGGSPITLPHTLAAGAHIDVTVTANAANRTGMLSGHIDVVTNITGATVPRVTLTGTSTAAAVMATAMADFGAVDIDATPSPTQTVTLRNTGDATLNYTLAAMNGGSAAFTFSGLPGGAATLAPQTQIDVIVTYKPTVERPAGSEETAVLVAGLTGVLGGPTMSMIAIKGRGIDRHLMADAAPTFPTTYRNPGDKAPIRSVTIHNTGEALLKVTAAMISSTPGGFTLMDTSPVDIMGGTSHDFVVKFAPTTVGTVTGQLVLTNNDNGKPMAMIPLTAIATDRNIHFGPTTINVGFTAVGIPITVTGMLTVANMNPADGFTIHQITLDDDSVFHIDNAPSDAPLPSGGMKAFSITFAPTSIDHFTTTAHLHIDQDPSDEGGMDVQLSGDAVFAEAHGSGGCSAGGAGSGGLVLGLAALAAMRRRRRRRLSVVRITAVAATLVLAPAAFAGDSIGIAVFEPTPATTGAGFALQAPDVGASGSWVMNATASYASNPLVLESFTVAGEHAATNALVSRSTLMQLGAAYALLDRFELGAHIPLYLQSGEHGITGTSASGTATGNLAVHAKARLWGGGAGPGRLVAGVAGSVVFPTATKGQFTGSDQMEGRFLVLGSYTPAALDSRLTISVNAGPMLRGTSQYANIVEKSGVAWGAGASYRILDQLWATAELFGESTGSAQGQQPMGSTMPPAITLSPTEALAGLSIRPDRRVVLGFALGRGVTSAIGTPDVRGVVSLSVVPGGTLAPIHGSGPARPDGDADGDGIPDSIDKCPNEPEDQDGFEDQDGCPDPDNDHDGIPDAADKCPLDPEDKDGFQDEDGCPDKDNDGDGIPDTMDKCPNEPEDKDGFEDLDGCPDPDNDHDGIPDEKDKCPNEPETINGFQDEDGCPDKGDSTIILSPDRIETLDPIQFTGVKLIKADNPILGQIAATLRAHGEIIRLRVTVHVQPSGDPDADQAKSDKRAQAVREWLVQWGITPSRLEVRGFGGTKPLVPPDQRGAAKINDRLELIILERK
jgi:hypothetical protein